MRRRWLFTGAVIAVVAVIIAAGQVSPRDRQRQQAKGLYRQAQVEQANGRISRQFELLLHALETDASYLPILFDLAVHPLIQYEFTTHAPRLIQTAIATDGAPFGQCIRELLLSIRDGPSAPRRGDMPSPAVRVCHRLTAMYTAADPSMSTVQRRGNAVAVWREYPESGALADWVVALHVARPTTPEARALAAEMTRPDLPPITRSLGFALQYRVYHVSHDSAGMAGIEAAARRQFRAYPALEERFQEVIGRRDRLSCDRRATESRRDWMPRLINCGIHAYASGQLRRSDSLWTLLLREFPESPDLVAKALVFRGRTHQKAGNLDRARADLLAARTIAERIDARPELLDIAHYLFHVYEGLGMPQEALEAGRTFIDRVQIRDRETARMMSYHDVGWYLWRLGRYEDARLLLHRMLTLVDSLPDYRHWAGEYYERTGDLQRALANYEAAIQIDPGDTRTLAQMVAIAARLGDSAQAFALARRHDGGQSNYPEFTPLLPAMLAQFGSARAALDAAERSQGLAQRRQQTAATATLLLQRARLARRPALADSAALLASRVGAFETEMLARGVAAHARGDDARLRAMVRSPAIRPLPFVKFELLRMLGHTYAGRGQVAAALGWWQYAAALNDSLAASLASDIQQAQLRGTARDVSTDALAAIAQSRLPARAALAEEWLQRRKTHGRSPTMRPPRRADTAVLDYFVLDTLVGVLVTTPTSRALHILPVTARALRLAISEFRAQLTPRVGNAIDAHRATYNRGLAYSLYRQLIHPFVASLRGVDQLLVVADGVLNELPFDALLTESRGDAYLIRRFRTHFASSALSGGASFRPSAHAVLAIGGDAPAAREEVEAIARVLGTGRVTVAAGTSATESYVRATAERASVLHFATHAAPNDAQPLFAYLALESDSANDGRLHAFEVQGWRLRGSLVVLSGCDTESGRFVSEGVLSLSRAFRRAGAAATIATLWPVGGGAAALMTDFYAGVARGETAAEALHQAKLKALEGPYGSPLYWAPFVYLAS